MLPYHIQMIMQSRECYLLRWPVAEPGEGSSLIPPMTLRPIRAEGGSMILLEEDVLQGSVISNQVTGSLGVAIHDTQ